MDEIFDGYFQRLLSKMDVHSTRKIQIAARDGRIIVKSDPELENISSSAIQSVFSKINLKDRNQLIFDNSGEYTVVATPLTVDWELMAIILVETLNLKQGETIAHIIKTSLEAYIEHRFTLRETLVERNKDESIIKELLDNRQLALEEQSISYHLFKTLKAQGLDLFLLRSVIIIHLEKKTNEFFNINLDLGYEASVERFKDKVVNVIKLNKHLNNQDLVAFLDNDRIVIVKSFINISDIYKLYFALDTICQSIIRDLDEAKIFAYRIAYGGIYSQFIDIKKSYAEASDTIRLAELFQGNIGIYSIDLGLLEHVAYYLPTIIKEKTIQMIVAKLTKPNGTVDLDLLSIADEFVGQSMNLSKTATALHMHRNTIASKIEKFKKQTGLNPEKSFRDAFLTKMAALLIKIDKLDK